MSDLERNAEGSLWSAVWPWVAGALTSVIAIALSATVVWMGVSLAAKSGLLPSASPLEQYTPRDADRFAQTANG